MNSVSRASGASASPQALSGASIGNSEDQKVKTAAFSSFNRPRSLSDGCIEDKKGVSRKEFLALKAELEIFQLLVERYLEPTGVTITNVSERADYVIPSGRSAEVPIYGGGNIIIQVPGQEVIDRMVQSALNRMVEVSFETRS